MNMSMCSAPKAVASICQAATRTQRRSLSSQCLRLSMTSQHISSRRRKLNNAYQRRHEATAAGAAAVAGSTNSKVSAIVDQISQLTLLETADLVASLKSRLNIPDMSFAAPAAAPAAGGAGSAAAAEPEEEVAPAAQEKTLFTLKLEKFEATAKPKVIKEVKSLLGLSLVDSKKFVESAPKVMKEGVAKEEAEKIVAAMKALGAEVKME